MPHNGGIRQSKGWITGSQISCLRHPSAGDGDTE
jgi:hypothetical protein